MTAGFIVLAALLWARLWRKRPAAPAPPSDRVVEARIRIGAWEPRLGQPKHRPDPEDADRRGFECVERVD